jgi:uncharacterized membrane protein
VTKKINPKNPATTPPKNHIATRVTHQQFSGPVPPPVILEDYDRIIPGAANRILEMAEKEAEHQRKMEETALSEAIKESKRGQNYGLVVTLAAFTTASFAIYTGAYTCASIIAGTTVVALVSVFVTGRLMNSNSHTTQNNKS